MASQAERLTWNFSLSNFAVAGELKTKLAFKVAGVSAGARQAIEGAGGSVELIEVVPAAEKAAAKKGKGAAREAKRAKAEA